MGDYVENYHFGPHFSAGAVTGYRAVIHKGSTNRYDGSGDATAGERDTLVAAAKTSETAFASAASQTWPVWWAGLSSADRTGVWRAVAAY